MYSQSLLIFIHKTTPVENHLTTRETRDLLRPRSTPTGNPVFFTWAASLFTYWKYTDEASNIASDEDNNNMENNCMFIMLSNLSVISHVIFPQCFFFCARTKFKNN